MRQPECWAGSVQEFQATNLKNLRTPLARYVLAQPCAQLVQVADRVGYRSLAGAGVVGAAAALPWSWVKSATILSVMADDKADYTSSCTRAQRSVNPASPGAGGGGIAASRASGLASRVRTVMLLVLLAGADLTTRASCASKRSCKILLLSFHSVSSRPEKARRGWLGKALP